MFGPKSLGDILSGFNKTLEELGALNDNNNKIVEENTVKVASLNLDSQKRIEENRKAASVYSKISELVS